MRGNMVCERSVRGWGGLGELSLDDVGIEARLEEARFVSGAPSSGLAGLELFRRAIDQNDERAWMLVMDLYKGLLLAQAANRALRGLVAESGEACVDRAFERFWLATRRLGIDQFGDLASVLKYLKMCLASVLLDEARARKRQACVSLDDMPPDAQVSDDPAAEAIDRSSAKELWETIQRELASDDERLLARLSFISGLTPREIRARYPRRFADVADVYRVKRNVIDRLRRSSRIQAIRNTGAAHASRRSEIHGRLHVVEDAV